MVQTPPKNPLRRLKNPPIKDTCGNFNVFFKKGFIDKNQVKEIKNYSKLHCVQYQLFMRVLQRQKKPWMAKLNKVERHEADARKWLKITKDTLKKKEDETLKLHYFKVRDIKKKYEIQALEQ